MQLINTIWTDANALARDEEGSRLILEAAASMREHYPGRNFSRATLTGRILLKSLLPGMSWEKMITQLTYLEKGKPFLPGQDLHFNISHSGNIVVLAWSARPVGIDVVDMRKPLQHPALFMHPAECRAMENKAVEEKQLFMQKVWARKEAIGKLSGDGWSPAFPNTDTTMPVFHGDKCISLEAFRIRTYYHVVVAAYDRIRHGQVTAFRFNHSFTHQIKEYAA